MRQSFTLTRWLGLCVVIVWSSPSALADRPDLFDGDARLSRPVRLELRHLSLDEALGVISKQVDVPLKAEGEAADLRVTAFVSGQPLRVVLKRISTLLHLTWRRDGQGERSAYSLYLSEKDRSAVEAARAAEWEAFRANIRRIIQAAAQPGFGGDDPRDRAAQSLASHAVPRGAALVLAGLPPSVLDAALRGEMVRLPFASLAPPQQELWRRYQGTAQAELDASGDASGPKEFEQGGRRFRLAPPDPPEPLEQGGLELRVVQRLGGGQRAMLALTRWGAHIHGTSILLGIIPTASIPIEEQERMPRQFDSRQCTVSRADALKLPEASLSWGETLARFARDNHVDVVSDAFDVDNRPASTETVWTLPAGTPAEGVLDHLCMPYDYTWNAAEPVLLFRQRDWSVERERQIPERLARHWREVVREQHAYPLADLAQMATLNDAQRFKMGTYAGEEAFRTVNWNREILLLYAALRPEQRALAGGEGLTIDRLDLAQQKLLPPLLARLRPGPLDLRRSLVRLEVREAMEEPATTIALVFRDGERKTVSLDRRAKPQPDPWPALTPQKQRPAPSN